MLITVADVVLRSFRSPILGTYELVGFLGAFAIGFALPQTSLDRGQVLMDFLARHLPASANRLLSVFTRAIGIGLFAVLAWHLATMGADQRRTGDVTPLLSLPLSWPAFGVAAACVVECFVLAATALPERGEGGGSGGTP